LFDDVQIFTKNQQYLYQQLGKISFS